MKLRFVWVGRTKNTNLAEMVRDYAARSRHFLPVEIIELKESRASGTRQIEVEGERILASLRRPDVVVALDANGTMWTSSQLADFLGRHMCRNPNNLAFVVGGYAGLADSVRDRAGQAWSLSPLTLTHELARVVVLEQVYRALSLIHNFPYPR